MESIKKNNTQQNNIDGGDVNNIQQQAESSSVETSASDQIFDNKPDNKIKGIYEQYNNQFLNVFQQYNDLLKQNSQEATMMQMQDNMQHMQDANVDMNFIKLLKGNGNTEQIKEHFKDPRVLDKINQIQNNGDPQVQQLLQNIMDKPGVSEEFDKQKKKRERESKVTTACIAIGVITGVIVGLVCFGPIGLLLGLAGAVVGATLGALVNGAINKAQEAVQGIKNLFGSAKKSLDDLIFGKNTGIVDKANQLANANRLQPRMPLNANANTKDKLKNNNQNIKKGLNKKKNKKQEKAKSVENKNNKMEKISSKKNKESKSADASLQTKRRPKLKINSNKLKDKQKAGAKTEKKPTKVEKETMKKASKSVEVSNKKTNSKTNIKDKISKRSKSRAGSTPKLVGRTARNKINTNKLTENKKQTKQAVKKNDGILSTIFRGLSSMTANYPQTIKNNKTKNNNKQEAFSNKTQLNGKIMLDMNQNKTSTAISKKSVQNKGAGLG